MSSRKFKCGETAEGYFTVKDHDGNYVDPTDLDITIYKPGGTEVLVDKVGFGKIDTGKYRYFFRTETSYGAGFYPASARSIDGVGADAIVTIQDGGVELEK